jgi:hypothetical protein
MGNTIFALMLVTANGVSEVAQFNNLDDCNIAKYQLTKAETFCYEKQAYELNQVFNQFEKLFERLQEGIGRLKKTQNNV